ncbi:MAG: RagB/SusD family nutrient uptake outer membrane protein [Bacteroidota bacterium]
MKKHLLFTLVAIVLLTTSCNDDEFFELNNPPEFPWLNMDELERGVVAPYNIALSSSWGNFMGNDRLLFDCMSDAVYLLPNTSADIPFEEMYFRLVDVETSRTNSGFRDGYKCITHANAVLDFLEETSYEPYGKPSETDRQNLDRIQGEMQFMRAFAYFHLAMRHAPMVGASNFGNENILPLRLTTPRSAVQANEAEYVSTDRIFEQIVRDLEVAVEKLPLSYESGIHHPSYGFGRANRYVAAALLGRVHFYLGNYDEAEQQLDFVISGPFNLSELPIEAFNKDMAAQGSEVIWSSSNYDRNVVTTNKTLTSMNYSDYRAENGGRGDFHKRCTWNQFPMSHTSLQAIGWMDDNLEETEAARADLRYQQLFWRLEGNNGELTADPTIYETQYVHIKEPMVWGDKYYRGTEGEFTNVPLIRLPEMLLTRAILRFNKGDQAGALNDLNQVREHAGLEPLTEITAEAIHQERLKEMAFEGDRLFYLKALQLPIPSGMRDVPAISHPYEGLYWTLPQAELDFKGG